MRDTVRFTLNGVLREVRASDPTRTLLDWLRCEARLTGTKEGCAEGDCGACTVQVVDPGGRVRAINSCIQFLPMLDGCAVTTVEGVGAPDDGLGVVQKAMVDAHGSQCGFCTPGIVMTLHAHCTRGGEGGPGALSDALAGNLCRCTGYGPILKAGEVACAMERPKKPRPLKAQDEALGYEMEGVDGPRRFFAPETLDDLAKLAAKHPDAVILAGATDIGLWVTKLGRKLPALISVMRVKELQQIDKGEDAIEIGAAVRYSDAHAALAKLHPAFGDYIRRLGAQQVRDSGTVVGNIANGSPIGDMPPALIALGASIRLRRGGRERELALEDFYIEYGKQDRKPGEIVTHVTIARPPKGALFAAEKISKRFEQDISAVSAGFLVRLVKGKVAEVRIAYGGMAGVPKRAETAEAVLMGAPWSEATVRAAMTALAGDFKPLSDWRGSAAYRLKSAQNLLLRFYLENFGDAVTRVGALGSVADG